LPEIEVGAFEGDAKVSHYGVMPVFSPENL
jgi:hypothetical protein